MPEKRLKTAQVNLRIDPHLKAAADKAAADDHRSLTSLIEKLLSDYLKRRGYLPKWLNEWDETTWAISRVDQSERRNRDLCANSALVQWSEDNNSEPAMPPRELRIPVTTGIPKSTFQFAPDSWQRVEKNYRSQIPSDVRDRIQEATRDYLQLVEMEQKAAPLASARNEISATRKAAHALIERLQAIQSCKTDVHSYVGHLISQRLLSDHLANLIRGLELLASALSEVDADGARQSALAETADARVERNGTAIPMPRETAKAHAAAAYKAKAVAIQSGGTQQEGEAWKGWVRKVRSALKEAGLPAGRTKLRDNPLFRIIGALQDELPLGHKTTESLAEAIYEATRLP